MKNRIRLFAIVFVVIVKLPKTSAYASIFEKNEFFINLAVEPTRHNTGTNRIESNQVSVGKGEGFYIKANSPTKAKFSYISTRIESQYNNEIDVDDLQKPIASIAKETGKVVVPNGVVLPKHSNEEDILKSETSGCYGLKCNFNEDYITTLTVDINENTNEIELPIEPILFSTILNNRLVNGEKVAFDSNTVNHNTNFELHDIANLLSVGVTLDGNSNTVGIATATVDIA